MLQTALSGHERLGKSQRASFPRLRPLSRALRAAADLSFMHFGTVCLCTSQLCRIQDLLASCQEILTAVDVTVYTLRGSVQWGIGGCIVTCARNHAAEVAHPGNLARNETCTQKQIVAQYEQGWLVSSICDTGR